MTEDQIQRIRDEEQLRALSIAYYTSAGVAAFASLFGLFYVFIGAAMGTVVSRVKPVPGQNQPPPELFFWLFGGIGLAFFVFFTALAFLKWRTALCLKRRRSPVLCQITAGLSCLEIPYGTVLGALTFIVLARPSVAALFHGAPGNGDI